MAEPATVPHTRPEQLRLFMKHLLNDLRALDRLLSEDRIERDVRRIGAEQELFLTTPGWSPAPVALEVLETLAADDCTTELGLFNVECNTAPLTFAGKCLGDMEASLLDAVARFRAAAKVHGARVVMTGILPTIRKSDLGPERLTPLPRYVALAQAIRGLRGGSFDLRVSGMDELHLRHDTVMLEACNTSCQFHFQVGADEFARLYNVAQAVTAPVLAAATNSPLLLGKRLWHETRVPLFQQAIDTRQPSTDIQDRSARVSFGTGWVRGSVVEIFREDIARFRVLLGTEVDEDPLAVLDAGGVPELQALKMFNGTVYRWNRPCYGVTDGKPHLRIENRVLPSGPSVLDEVANAALWFGLMSGLAHEHEDIAQVMDFDTAKGNFVAAARLGLDARLGWLDGRRRPARDLILETLLPMARSGLDRSGIDAADAERYLGVIEKRVTSEQTGSEWILKSLAGMEGKGTRAERMRAIVAATVKRQQDNKPVHDWPLAQLRDAGGWKHNYLRVEQIMTTDVFSVHEDDVIDLVASVMDWRKIRHVPVEDDQHHLVGLVSYRALLRLLAQDLPHGKDNPVPVRDMMQRDPITVTPETHTLEAIRIMRAKGVTCLPVVKEGRLVGIFTEHDLTDIAAELLESKLRE